MNLLEILCDWQTTARDQHLRPCLIGNTGTGKTTKTLEYARARNLPVQRLLLGSMLPEDVLGLPRVIDGVTVWTLPEWAKPLIDNPGVLFLDELDKSSRECVAAALTLLAEKRIHQHLLHPRTVIVAAAQPSDLWNDDETGRALLARIVPICLAADWKWLGDKHAIILDDMPQLNAPKIPQLPNPSPRQVDWWLDFAAGHEKEVSEAIARILFAPRTVEYLLAQRERRVEVRADDLVWLMENKPTQAAEVLSKCSIPERVALAGPIIHHLPLDVWAETVYHVWTEGTQEDAEAYLKNQYEYLQEKVKAASSGEIDVLCGCTDDQFKKVLNSTARRIGETWIERKKKEEKKGKKK